MSLYKEANEAFSHLHAALAYACIMPSLTKVTIAFSSKQALTDFTNGLQRAAFERGISPNSAAVAGNYEGLWYGIKYKLDLESNAAPKHGWTCFHCGETFTTVGAARDHFGADPNKEPGCLARVQLGPERGLLMLVRKLEEEIGRLNDLMEVESCEGYKAYRGLQARLTEELRNAEELGYARGLADARKEPS